MGGAVGLGASGKGPTCRCRKRKRCRFNPWVGKIPSGRKWHPTPVFLPRKFHRQRKRSLSGYSSWGHRESDMTACRALQDSGHTSQVGHMICLFQLTVPFIFSPVKNFSFQESSRTIAMQFFIEFAEVHEFPGNYFWTSESEPCFKEVELMWKKSLDLKARQSLSFSHCHVQLFATLWTVAHQAPLFMGFSRQEYFSGLPFPPPGGIFLIKEWNLRLLHWQADSLPLSYQGSLGRPDSKSCRCLGVWGGNT